MDPYDLKPMGNAKVPVNLDFFLTDCDNRKPVVTEIDTQTDQFQPRPLSPTYIPKKTGIDVETQIEDWELFSFDREVKPISRVIVTKTIEQAALELEEEREMKRMAEYKANYKDRRINEKSKWRKKLNDEIETMSAKNKLLDILWQKEQNIINTSNKLQAYEISRAMLRNVKSNALVKLYESGIYPSTFTNQL